MPGAAESLFRDPSIRSVAVCGPVEGGERKAERVEERLRVERGINVGVRVSVPSTSKMTSTRAMRTRHGRVAGRLPPACPIGTSSARHEAYRIMVARGFRTFLQGVAMDKPNEEGFNRQGVYVVDDWR